MGEIINERDYIIKKGRCLEKFGEEFFVKHNGSPLYRGVLELLIRDADPYEIIEKLIEINSEQSRSLRECMELMPPKRILKP